MRRRLSGIPNRNEVKPLVGKLPDGGLEGTQDPARERDPFFAAAEGPPVIRHWIQRIRPVFLAFPDNVHRQDGGT